MKKRKKRNKLSSKAGLPPGSLVYTGRFKEEPIRFSRIRYDTDSAESQESGNAEELLDSSPEGRVSWYNINGLSDAAAIERIGSHFELHSLMLEDILNIDNLPKMEEFDNCLFFNLKMIKPGTEPDEEAETEHLSLVLGKNYLISFQERPGDVFGPIRERILNGLGKVRQRGADYLFYLLIDSIVDAYYFSLEQYRENIYSLEERMVEMPGQDRAWEILALKRELMSLRKTIGPMREAIHNLHSGEPEQIKEPTYRYFSDLRDHINHIYALFEEFREMVDGLMTLNMTNISNSMNGVMKTLTIISTIFIPLTFLAGIYGMNFEVMPETKWKYGYPILLCAMVVLGFVMFRIIQRRKWF